MNAILIPPKTSPETAPENYGSGRYYARFSQTERLSDTPGELYPAIWVFEAFDRDWFEANQLPSSPNGLEGYYNRPELYVLELRIESVMVWPVAGLAAIHAADVDDAEPNDWFVLQAAPLGGRVPNEGEIPMTIYPNLYAAGTAATLLEARPADPATSARLDRAASTAHIPDASEQDVDNAMAGVASASIEWVVIYDVGQGNAIGLCEPSGSVKGYFDLGGGVTGNAKTFPTVLTHFCFTQQPTIILSHWDFDHWSSANRDTRSQSMTWIAPRQSVGPTHLALMTSIQSTGKLLLIPTGFPAKRHGQVYLELCTGKGRNHSGLALTLSKQATGAGDQMLFPGDARYTYILSFPNPPKNQYVSAVVPHHGGDMRSRTVPLCPSVSHSRLLYSFGAGNTFSHPRQVTRVDHHNAAWRNPHIGSGSTFEVREMANRGTKPLGHVYPHVCPCAPVWRCVLSI
jgi:hypothetical protein